MKRNWRIFAVGENVRHIQIVLPSPWLPIPACSTRFRRLKEQAFLCLVHTVHVGRGIIKLVWGVNVESYQGRLCVSLQRLKATAVENGKPASAKPISFKTIRTVPSE